MKKIFLLILISLNTASFSQCFTKIYSRNHHNLAEKADGSLWVWGWGNFGQLGNVTGDDSNVPILLTNDTDWKFVTAGTITTYGIKNNGTLWCAGADQYAFNGSTNYTISQVGTDNDWKMVKQGQRSTVGIKNNNTLWAWGANDYFQLGDGTTIVRQNPVQISIATDWKKVDNCTIGPGFALKTDGTLWGWGENGGGILGGSLLGTVPVPTQRTPDTDWKDFVLGGFHILALKNNNTLWSWGGTGRGETGDGLVGGGFRQPAQVGTATDWKTIAAGKYTSFAIKTNGTLWAWGDNTYGQMGNGNTITQYSPIQIGTDTNWASVQGGENHTIALKTNGSLWAWGDNNYGQLGTGDNVPSLVPIQIPVSGCNLANDVFVINQDFKISPNPATNSLTITNDKNLTIQEIVIFNTIGQKIKSIEKINNTIDISDLQSGHYLLKIKSDEKVSSLKFVKK